MRLADILKKEEIARVSFDERKVAEFKPTREVVSPLSVENTYEELLGLARRSLSNIFKKEPLNLPILQDKLNSLIDYIAKDEGAFLRLIDRYDNPEDYLVVHSVNVCILSLEIARGLSYGQEAMLDLGLGAFLHDIGMLRVKNILQNKRSLFTAEYEEVKNHVNYGVEILQGLGLNPRVINVILQHHERLNGSGYLKGLSANEIDEYAKITGLADVYEALIHSRSYRKRFVPFEYETIREIISNREMFDPYILRVFLERLTRHPAYMLWLATDGIYEILKKKDRPTQVLEIKRETKTSFKKRYFLITALLTIVLIGIYILKSSLFIPQREIFYPQGSSLNIANNRQPLKISYNFISDITDSPSISLDLSGINLDGYHFLAFSSKVNDKEARRIRYATLKITLENLKKETSHYYLQDISNRWKEFRIPLSYFDTIKDWSSLVSASFTLEPWNIDAKQGALYIDDIRFFRKK